VPKKILPWIGIVCIAFAFTHGSVFAAASPYGVGVSGVIIGQQPESVHGLRVNMTYEPPPWAWKHWHIFFDASLGHWWVSNGTPHHSLNIFSIAPVFRYFFKSHPSFIPFIDLSIGAAYLSKTRFSNLNLGMHFSFQDMVGLGLALGQNKNLLVSLSAIHYSNASLCSSNSGITAPLLLNISYRF